MKRAVDLSCDIGESFGSYRMGNDDQILTAATSANVACGFHAGDPAVMATAVAQCVARGVAVGAHPGFPDLVGFGRRTVETSPTELRTDVLYQLGALSAFTRAAGTPLTHVSPHGRLGNLVVEDDAYARPVLDAIRAFDPALIVVTYAGVLAELARAEGLRVGLLAFPDRAYEDDGALVPRREPEAVFHDAARIADRALGMVETGQVVTRTGATIDLDFHSLLLHGDNAASVAAAHEVRRALEAAGVAITPLPDLLA